MQSFGFTAAAENNKFHFGKAYTAQEQSFKGLLDAFSISCRALPITKFKLWRLLPFAYSASLRTFYTLDQNIPYFTNYASAQKQPMLYKGATGSTEASDPAFIGNVLQVSQSTFVSQERVKYDFGASIVHVSSHFLRIRVSALPSSGNFGAFFSLRNDKVIEVQMTSIGSFRVVSGSTVLYQATGVLVGAGQWHWVKITHARGGMEESVFDCLISIEVVGFEEEGTNFSCKSQKSPKKDKFKKIKKLNFLHFLTDV